jgi:thiol-disulfide isomerase/thioredoxin
MKKKYIVGLAVVILAAVALLYSGYNSILNSSSTGAKVVKTDTKIDTLSAKDTEDHTVTLNHKHIVVYDFFASWCIPCQTSVPDAVKFAKNNSDIPVIGIAYRDVPSEVKKFESKYGSFSTTVMSTGKVERIFGVRSLPQTLFVENGKVLYRIYGAANEHDLENVLALVKTKMTSSQ